ncbi:MAG: pyruvate dehydrogenase (acetyl-transferring) E1 component subunit alpha [Nitrospinae bacterium]|nr:pyruvate dehydrogenase (acetyl-transferring) E1 component subunit alpha [Nitrospinota bacterium]
MPRKVLESFNVSYLQILDADGHLDATLEPDLPAESLRTLYRTMVLARQLDRRMLALQRQGRLGTFAPIIGQEASQVGSAFALEPTDWMIPSFRETAAYIVRGLPLKHILLYYMGREEGNAIPEGQRNLPVAIPVASQLPHAVGIALAAKIRHDPCATLAYFGDGATSEGDFHEACNFAGVFQLPLVFLCQNNQYAISYPRKRQTWARTLAQKAIAYGFDGLQVDGNDLLAVYVATRDALSRAKAGNGPTLIESVTYRLGLHTTADDPSKYRTKAEEEEWQKKDPIPRFREYLKDKGLWDDAWQARLEEEVEAEMQRAVEEAEAERGVDPADIFDYVFAAKPPFLSAQQQEARAALRRGEDVAHG